MTTKNIFSYLKALLLWIPFFIFFSILITMITSEFKNPTDEYFVSTVLRGCLMLIISTFMAHLVCIGFLAFLSYTKFNNSLAQIEAFVKAVGALPIVDIGIYSVALFVAHPEFAFWHQIITVLLIVPTLYYWILFLKGPIRNLHQFALFHQVKQKRITNVLSSFYISAFIDYFFIVLKRSLLPLVFILAVMDFKIMLPHLVEGGLSYLSVVMFFSLVLSLHLLTASRERTP